MRCPSCGAVCKKRSMKCAECGAFRNRTWVETEATVAISADSGVQQTVAPQIRRNNIPKPSTSLIEFPSPGRQPIPQWRKELGERVREVQERKAREAILESGEINPELDGELAKAPRPLELLAKPLPAPTNPLVVAALRRIERAHTPAQYSQNTAVATATAYQEEAAYELAPCQPLEEVSPTEQVDIDNLPEETEPTPDRTHHLSVVATPIVVAVEEVPAIEECAAVGVEEPLEIEASIAPVAVAEKVIVAKPKRLIRDNDPALDYLDSVPTTVRVECNEIHSAPVYARFISALLDFVVAAMMAAPVVALVKLTELRWQDPRVIGFAAGTFVVSAFLYFTISTALTGRTFAMRLFSIRVVDARTGLIPTGAQSTGRAFLYLLSIAIAGLGLMFSLLDRERRTAHDRLTRTAVVRI